MKSSSLHGSKGSDDTMACMYARYQNFLTGMQVSYVLDTEDWFWRKRQKRGSGFDRVRRTEHFENWLKSAAKDAALFQLPAASLMLSAPIETTHYPAPVPG